mmetsp:Transcript_14409/g.28798  ORF Transcript_14409/g.28798 Transcript_14409/m.28798 type:complete len:451 (+) Transcript_14409:1186-2538(+)
MRMPWDVPTNTSRARNTPAERKSRWATCSTNAPRNLRLFVLFALPVRFRKTRHGSRWALAPAPSLRRPVPRSTPTRQDVPQNSSRALPTEEATRSPSEPSSTNAPPPRPPIAPIALPENWPTTTPGPRSAPAPAPSAPPPLPRSIRIPRGAPTSTSKALPTRPETRSPSRTSPTNAPRPTPSTVPIVRRITWRARRRGSSSVPARDPWPPLPLPPSMPMRRDVPTSTSPARPTRKGTRSPSEIPSIRARETSPSPADNTAPKTTADPKGGLTSALAPEPSHRLPLPPSTPTPPDVPANTTTPSPTSPETKSPSTTPSTNASRAEIPPTASSSDPSTRAATSDGTKSDRASDPSLPPRLPPSMPTLPDVHRNTSRERRTSEETRSPSTIASSIDATDSTRRTVRIAFPERRRPETTTPGSDSESAPAPSPPPRLPPSIPILRDVPTITIPR